MAQRREPTSDTPPETLDRSDVAYTVPETQAFGLQAAAAETPNVLIVKDCNPWETTANEQVLDDLGATYDVSASDLNGVTLQDYSVVILPSTQDANYYAALADASDDIESFVEAGGTLVAHVTDDGWPCTTVWNESFVPGGVSKETNLSDDVGISNSDHPVVGDFTESALGGWGSSAHGYLTNLPEDATVAMTYQGDADRPTYAEFSHGDGRVLVTMQTLEWPYSGDFAGGADAKQLLQNELSYALGAAQAPDQSVRSRTTILHYINGKNENVSDGGHPLHSAQMQVFPEDGEFEISTDGLLPGVAPSIDGTLSLPVEPVIDNWQKGDMIDTHKATLSDATDKEEDKYIDEFPGESFNKFRFMNDLEVTFDSPDGEQIDEDSLLIRLGEQGASDGTVEYRGTEESYTVLVGDDVNNLETEEWFDSLREKGTRVGRDFDWEFVDVDGVEAVRISTVTAGYAGHAQDIADIARSDPIYFVATLFDWDLAIEEYLPDLPDVPLPDDLPDPGDALDGADWENLPDPGDWAPDVDWDDVPDLPDADDLGDLPNVDAPDFSDPLSDVDWDDVPDFPSPPELDTNVDLPDRPDWDDVPDAPDGDDVPDCEDVPGVDGCPDVPFSLGGAGLAASAQSGGSVAGSSSVSTADATAAGQPEPIEDGFDQLSDAVKQVLDAIEPYLPSEIQGLGDILTLVPNIYSFQEMYVLADGRTFVRLWDTSPFPSWALYFNEDRREDDQVPYEKRQLFNHRMMAFFAMAEAGVTPYGSRSWLYRPWLQGTEVTDAPDVYLRNYVDLFPGFGDDLVVGDDAFQVPPIWEGGFDESDEPIEIPDGVLDSDVPDPF